METSIFRLLAVLAGTILTVGVAQATPIVFTGVDPAANCSSPHPISSTAAANFDIQASIGGPITVIDLESPLPVIPFAILPINSDLTLTGFATSIRNTPFGSPPARFGCNTTTTSGANQFAFINGGSLTFNFTSPVSAFGAFLSGVQLGGETMTFSDGTSRTIMIPNPGIDGGVEFVGFTNPDRCVSSVTVSAPGDLIGLDDVHYVKCMGVPEPSIVLLFGLGALAIGGSRTRKQR